MGKCLQEILDELPIKERKIDFEKPFIVYGIGEVGESFFYTVEANKSYGLLPNKNYISFYIGEGRELFKGYKVYNRNFLKENYDTIYGKYHIVIAANVVQYAKIEQELLEFGYEKGKDFFKYEQILRKLKLDKEFFRGFVASEEGAMWLNSLKAPLYIHNSEEGKFFKRLMLTDFGKKLRETSEKFKPICRQRPVILSDGRVSMCVKGTLDDLIIGDLYKENLKDILARKKKIDLYDYAVCRDCLVKDDICTNISLLATPKERDDLYGSNTIDSLQIEVFSGCNYKCTLCAVNKLHKYRKLGAMDLEVVFENIQHFLPLLKSVLLYNHGEPLLHENLIDFVKKCRAIAPDLYMSISSNAMLLNEKVSHGLVEARVDSLIVSVHGAPGTDGLIRYAVQNADYDQVLENVKNLIKIRGDKKYPHIRMKSALFDWNDTDEKMHQFRLDAQGIGLKPIGDSEEGYYWVPNLGGDGSYDQSSSSNVYLDGSEALNALINKGEYRRA